MVDEVRPECLEKRKQVVADIRKTYNLCTKQLTSTNVGHKFIQPINLKEQVFTLRVPKESQEPSVTLKEAENKTTQNASFDWPYNENDRIDRAQKLNGLGFQYIKPYAEHVKVNPPKPHRSPLSEFQDKYPPHQISSSKTKVVNLKPAHECKVQSSGKDQQPPLRTESEGFLKHLDIYISTSHFSHHPFNLYEVDQYKSKPFKSESAISTRIKPVYDVTVFKEKYHEKILPKVSHPVPHSGMESEMKSNYRLPVNELSTVRIGSCTQMPPLTVSSKAEIMSIPAMYDTEYNKLGKKWDISALLNNKAVKS